MERKAIHINVSRQLWAQCGGYCQNPACNKWLFASVGNECVSIANVAHIIGQGFSGPRSEHELADFIEKDGLGNLLMLCLECHKIVDELERQFSVEQLLAWKEAHAQGIAALFKIPKIKDERELLVQINELLDVNAAIFKEYGPFSDKVVKGEAGDALIIWRRRCVDTILLNNQKILDLIEKNKSNFPYPWDVYQQMLGYKMHADAFKDNCLLGQRVNDYKLFPLKFDHFVKSRLGIDTPALETRGEEELEYRKAQVEIYINRFLADHNFIRRMEKLNIATLVVDLIDGRTLRVFVTNTYYFTEYSLERVLTIDPQIDAIICSNPSGQYSISAKEQCIENKVGLFMLNEFMGAVRLKGDGFLNYLLVSDQKSRVNRLKNALGSTKVLSGLSVYVFGSYLRRKVCQDIDVALVYGNDEARNAVPSVQTSLTSAKEFSSTPFDFTICTKQEFENLRLQHDNLTRLLP